jgi:DNA primase
MEKQGGSDRFDIRALYRFFVPSLGLESRKGYVLGFCPFHDHQRPALSVHMTDGLWHCVAGCGSGDILSFYMRLKGVNHKTAIKSVAHIARRLRIRSQQDLEAEGRKVKN